MRRRLRSAVAFFRLPGEGEKGELRALYREQDELLRICDDRLQEIGRLHVEAERLLEAINSLTATNAPAEQAR